MNDADISQHIAALVKEEHDLLERGEAGSLSRTEHQRLADIDVRFDQYWDLLRQRRARRDAGQDPTVAQMRPPDVVEKYKQ